MNTENKPLGSEKITTCPLCGFKIRVTAATCGGCAVNSACVSIKCPACHYEFVEESQTWNALVKLGHWLKKIFRREDSNSSSQATLAHQHAGTLNQIVSLSFEDPLQTEHLVSMGLLPGSLISLKQKRPAFLIQIDQTEIVLDQEIAEKIHVQPILVKAKKEN